MSIGTKIGDCVFRTLGTMNTKVIARKCSEIGEKIGKIAKEKGSVESPEFQSVLAGVLGKRSKNIFFAGDKETFIREAQTRLHVPPETAEEMYIRTASCVLPAHKRGDSTFLDLRLQSLKNEELANVSAHECEHALFDAFHPSQIFSRLFRSLPYIRTKVERFGKKYGDTLNKKSLQFQGVINSARPEVQSITGLTQKELKTQKEILNLPEIKDSDAKTLLYGTGVLEVGKDKQNYLVASALHSLFKDEARAYYSGGAAERAFYKLTGKDTGVFATSSDLRSYVYKALVPVFKKEAKHSRNNWLKSKLGMTPNHEAEEKTIQTIKAAVKAKQEAEALKQAAQEESFWTNAADWAV